MERCSALYEASKNGGSSFGEWQRYLSLLEEAARESERKSMCYSFSLFGWYVYIHVYIYIYIYMYVYVCICIVCSDKCVG